jgi:transcriptional regulator with XRE-family HTH domain
MPVPAKPPKPPNPVDIHVGMRIRKRRVERKMRTATLGKALGLAVQQIQKYETGTNRIGASALQQICAVLEIPVSFVFEGAPGSSPFESDIPQDIIDFVESPEGMRFVAAFSKITDPQVRQGIARLAGRIADHVQSRPMAELLQFRERIDGPADKT